MIKIGLSRLICLFMLFSSSDGVIAEIKSLCVFDLLGANGPIFAQMKDYKIAALDWGIDFQLKPYLSERQAVSDFKSAVCDAVSLTGIQSRQFNSFTGTIDAMGALPSYEHLRILIKTISSVQAAPLMINKPYEIAGIIPLGAVYLFLNDRSLVINQIDKSGNLAAIRVAIMDDDPAQLELVGLIGTSPIRSSIAGMYRKFNEGLVDATYGPAVVYEAMELQKGMHEKGGVIRFPLAQLTLQLVIRKQEFPEKFAGQSRKYTVSQFDQAVKLANNFEGRIAEHWWIDIPEVDQNRYHELYRKVRISLRDKDIYNHNMLKIMRLVRCKMDARRFECTASDLE